MGDLRNALLIVILLSLEAFCAPVSSNDEKIEVHCISDYRQYCKGKPNGLTFSDGCRECKCEKRSVLCRKGGCSSFAKSDEDVLDYCDSVNQKNAQILERKKEKSKVATKPDITAKTDFNSPKPDELTESERAEATAKILKLFDDYISGVTTETSKISQERSTVSVKQENEDIPTNLVSKPGPGGFQQKLQPSTLKFQDNAPFTSSVSQKQDSLYTTFSKKRNRIPSRDQFDIDDELSSWPYQSGRRPSRRIPTYLKNDIAEEYDIFAPENQYLRRERSGRRYSGLIGASASYPNNLKGLMWDRDSLFHKNNVYRFPNQYQYDFNNRYRDNYLRLPYPLPRPPKESPVGQDRINAVSYDNEGKIDETGQSKYDFVEDSQMESIEKKFDEMLGDITSFIILNRMAINLLASENASYSTEETESTRNSSEFKYIMTVLEGNLDFLEAELKEVVKQSNDEKLEFVRSMPLVLLQLTGMTKQAKATLGDSADPSELIKNQQLDGIFVMMDDVIAGVGKNIEAVNKKYHEDTFRREWLSSVYQCADYAHEVNFLKRKLARILRRLSRIEISLMTLLSLHEQPTRHSGIRESTTLELGHSTAPSWYIIITSSLFSSTSCLHIVSSNSRTQRTSNWEPLLCVSTSNATAV
ncbi:hypothetical protein Aperf_G00000031235 [Anoplocephala perfoliata]